MHMSFFIVVLFFFNLKTLNCDVCKIRLKLGVCTVMDSMLWLEILKGDLLFPTTHPV